jgi:ferredoxin-NADP reductase/predicted pyridoxine 5'-phosphate oxidase superfamily flavin-nucleotide-binding protein
MLTDNRTENASPWHPGEIALQTKVGVVERMDDVGRRVLRNYLIEQHRQFYPQLPFIVMGAVDKRGDAWATLRANHPGFLQSHDPRALSVSLTRDFDDPADGGMEDGDAIGMLGIELHTRRRNRLNGNIRRLAADRFEVKVGQSYGNCPQYIQQRDVAFIRDPSQQTEKAPVFLDRLDARATEIIANADTFFVASYVDREDGGRRQVDVSHRGGKAGFVRIGDDGVLTIPDFAGNLFFNTLGNLLANPRAGLVFADFENGDLLQLSGEAEVILESPEIAAFQGAERLWRFRPQRIVYRPDALPLRWNFRNEGRSPNSLMTGSWGEAARRLKAAELSKNWRRFRIAGIVEESATIRSFHLEPIDGGGLIPHLAGQHLPIRLKPEGAENPVIRTYTLSTAPSDGTYRISVKRQGIVSRHLHEVARQGDIIEARAPAGAFAIDAAQPRPAVLLAAGVGITPLLAMLRHIVYEGLRKRRMRPTWMIYSAHDKSERAFAGEIKELVATSDGAARLVRVLSDTEGAIEGEDYDLAGRIDMTLLKSVLPFDDYDFYLCGPTGFMQSIHDGLTGLGIAEIRVHAETFGPVTLKRKADQNKADQNVTSLLARTAATTSVSVHFMRSAKEALWKPHSGTLLEFAEARGLAPEFSCRHGTCGSCRTKVLAGAVAYRRQPTASIGRDEALICCSVPAADSEGGSLKLDL